MSNEIEKPVAMTTANFNFGGVSFYILFLEKLKLYQSFLHKQSLWEKNKLKYWQQEKVILLWAWSNVHQHLARYLDTKRLAEIYGFTKSQNESQDKSFIKIHEPQFEIKNQNEIIREMDESNFGMLESIMGNLCLKGFASGITYKDFADLLHSSEIDELEKEAKEIFTGGLLFTMHSIVINTRGLLMGELVYEENKGLLWKYKLVKFLIYHFGFFSLFGTVFLLINKIFDIKFTVFFEPVWNIMMKNSFFSIIILVFWTIFFWRKL